MSKFLHDADDDAAAVAADENSRAKNVNKCVITEISELKLAFGEVNCLF